MNDEQILITKANGEKEPFDVSKLEYSLTQANATPTITQKVIEHILDELEEGMTTKEIYRHAFEQLRKLEKPSATRYSLRRAIMDLGPSGFPFEKFIAEVYKSQGYEAITDQIVLGGCVEHEVDVVAWKGDELIMSEVKFHHELGLKSDLKVVLYVKARFDDLKENVHDYGGKQRKMTEGRLITNTKFTISAIKYAQCQNMTIVGWNYPVENNLHHMIEVAGLHPLTCLTSLADHDKKALMEKGIVLCKTIQANTQLLKDIGLNQQSISEVLAEINTLHVV